MSEPDLTSMNISLPSELRRWVEQRVSEGGYGSSSEYVRELIRHDRARMEERDLEHALLKGLRSGSGGEMTAEDLKRIRRKVTSVTKRRRSA